MTISYSLKEIQRVAKQLIEKSTSHIWLFFGQMGAGKTVLISAICREYKVLESVCSPTFSLVNEYAFPKGKIYHMDLYRIKTIEELLNIGFEDYLSSKNTPIFIEWPQLAMPLLPKEAMHIDIQVEKDKQRIIKIQ